MGNKVLVVILNSNSFEQNYYIEQLMLVLRLLSKLELILNYSYKIVNLLKKKQ